MAGFEGLGEGSVLKYYPWFECFDWASSHSCCTLNCIKEQELIQLNVQQESVFLYITPIYVVVIINYWWQPPQPISTEHIDLICSSVSLIVSLN